MSWSIKMTKSVQFCKNCSPQFMRIFVCDTATNTWPKETNAILVSGGTHGLCGYVLRDEDQTVQGYNWGWIRFEKDRNTK